MLSRAILDLGCHRVGRTGMVFALRTTPDDNKCARVDVLGIKPVVMVVPIP